MMITRACVRVSSFGRRVVLRLETFFLPECDEVALGLTGERKSIIHVGSFLESTGTEEGSAAVFGARTVAWTSDPANAVRIIERQTRRTFLLGKKLG